MPGRWVYPLDPECPEYSKFRDTLYNDPMSEIVPSDVLVELMEDYERKHRAKCKRCQEYGAANVDVEY